MSWQPTLGARPESGGVRFRVWAHDKRAVEVVLAGSDSRPIPLEKQPDGTFAGLVPGLAARGPLPLPRRRPRPLPRPGLAVPARGRARAVGGHRPDGVRLDRRRLARGHAAPT